jgi:hypothetical protein
VKTGNLEPVLYGVHSLKENSSCFLILNQIFYFVLKSLDREDNRVYSGREIIVLAGGKFY